jgi:type VI secretion system secreted protein VgrG
VEPFLLEYDALPGRPRVLAFRGKEEIGRCFEYEVCFTLDDDSSSEVDPKRLLGERAALTVGESAGQISGRVAELELIEDAPYAVLRMRLVPDLWFLRLSAHSRVFVNESVPDILRKVLEQAGIAADAFELRLTRDYAKREHVCQYQESDLDFIQRWMEREGLYYFFDHRDPNSKLVICDAKEHHAPLRGDAVAYHPVTSVDESSGESFGVFKASWTALPKDVAEADYNYLKPDLRIQASEPVAPEFTASVRRWAENEPDAASALRIAKLRAEGELCRRRHYVAKGMVFGVHSGFTFRLDRHPVDELNREYLAVRIVLLGQRSGSAPPVFSFFSPEESAELGREVFRPSTARPPRR